jgi:hypothetical protein
MNEKTQKKETTMKSAKRLTCLLATVAMVVGTYTPAKAEYFGTLPREQDWVLQLTNSSNDKCVVAVYYVDKRRSDLIETLTVSPAGMLVQTFPKPGPGVKYVFIEVDPSPGGRAAVSINQSTTFNVDEGKRLVLDVSP